MKRTKQLAAFCSLLAGLLLATAGGQAKDLQSMTHPICEAGNPISQNFGVADSCTWLEAKIYYDGDTIYGDHRVLPWVEFESDPACEVAVTKRGLQSTIVLRDTNFSVLRFDDPYNGDSFYGTEFSLRVRLPTGCALALRTKERSNVAFGSFTNRAIDVPESYVSGSAMKMKFELRYENATVTEITQ